MMTNNHAALLRMADLHTRAVQSWLSSRSPDAARLDGLGVSCTSTGYGVPLLNLAIGGEYPPDTDGQTITDEIERVKAFFKARGVPWYWWLSNTPQPSDLVTHMERQGLIFDRPPLPAMVAPLPKTQPMPGFSPDIQVWQAETRADLEAASTIRRIAFRFPEGTAAHYFEAMADDWLRGDPAKLYLARVNDGEPACIAAIIMGEDVPGVYVMATLPEWRNRGLGKAIMARIMNEAAAGGHKLIVLTASKMGFPLYQQFGFERVFDYLLYRDGS